MKGLFLQGGGAKGAFQAGVLVGLHEKGIEFDIVTGVSIGAIHTYLTLCDEAEHLQQIWSSGFLTPDYSEILSDQVLENSSIINKLNTFDTMKTPVKHAYVNYVEIEGCQPKEVIVDLVPLSKKERLEVIRYSGLLPLRLEKPMTYGEVVQKYDSPRIFGEFQEDLLSGQYNGYKLDGGILNNELVEPFYQHDLEDVYLVILDHNYKIPEQLIQQVGMAHIHVFKPETQFKSGDLLNLDPNFLGRLFIEGYEMTKK